MALQRSGTPLELLVLIDSDNHKNAFLFGFRRSESSEQFVEEKAHGGGTAMAEVSPIAIAARAMIGGLLGAAAGIGVWYGILRFLSPSPAWGAIALGVAAGFGARAFAGERGPIVACSALASAAAGIGVGSYMAYYVGIRSRHFRELIEEAAQQSAVFVAQSPEEHEWTIRLAQEVAIANASYTDYYSADYVGWSGIAIAAAAGLFTAYQGARNSQFDAT